MMGAFVTVAIGDCISLPVKLLLRTPRVANERPCACESGLHGSLPAPVGCSRCGARFRLPVPQGSRPRNDAQPKSPPFMKDPMLPSQREHFEMPREICFLNA